MRKAKMTAAGGILTALTVGLCMLGSLSVACRFFVPAVCGIGLLFVKRYLSGWLSVMVYGAASCLMLLLPDRLTAAAYILLFGYYPILRDAVRKWPAVPCLALKLSLAAALGAGAFYGAAGVLGLWENSVFRDLLGLMIACCCVLAVFYELFLALLTKQMETRWDDRLKKIFH